MPSELVNPLLFLYVAFSRYDVFTMQCYMASGSELIIPIKQNRLRWHGHVLRKDAYDWEKKSVDFELQNLRHRDRPKEILGEPVEKTVSVEN